jgi:hypothetical protein
VRANVLKILTFDWDSASLSVRSKTSLLIIDASRVLIFLFLHPNLQNNCLIL